MSRQWMSAYSLFHAHLLEEAYAARVIGWRGEFLKDVQYKSTIFGAILHIKRAKDILRAAKYYEAQLEKRNAYVALTAYGQELLALLPRLHEEYPNSSSIGSQKSHVGPGGHKSNSIPELDGIEYTPVLATHDARYIALEGWAWVGSTIGSFETFGNVYCLLWSAAANY